MTVAEIQAGPELDAEIARRVFGIDTTGKSHRYSADIAAAWLVFEKMRGIGFESKLIGDSEGTAWTAEFWIFYPTYRASDQSAPLAICRAALAALG